MPHIQIIQLPANQNVNAALTTQARNNHQRVTLDWDDGHQDVLDTLALPGPPFAPATPFGGVAHNSGPTGILKVKVEHQNAGGFVASAVTIQATQGPTLPGHTLGALDATPAIPVLNWDDSRIIVM